MSRRKPRRNTGAGLIVFIVLVIFGIVSYARINLEGKRDSVQAKIEEVQAQKEAQLKKAEEIEKLSAYVQTKKYIEDMAREKLGLVYEDEIIFRPSEE